jgi:hypothetical protein
MADPQSSSPVPGGPVDAATEDVRIEHLLVAGLDHYFAGDFEAAINLWTRVLFLDRHHDRARAYIDRARSAQAERQRQHEALVHQGLAAFDRGEVEQARELLRDALDRGASHDLALGVLGRIERLDVSAARVPTPKRGRAHTRAEGLHRPAPPRRLSPFRFWTLTSVLLAALVTAGWWLWTTSAWHGSWTVSGADARMATIPEVNAPLPVPSVSEVYMRRGRELFDSGRLRDALVEFDRVPAGDPLRASADEMRALIQRELLALALADTAPAPVADPPSATPPPE